MNKVYNYKKLNNINLLLVIHNRIKNNYYTYSLAD